MRRRILTLLLAALAVAIAVPLGAAWSSDRRVPLGRPALVESVVLPAPPLTGHTGDALTLLLAGGILIGLGIVVRKPR
jgi:hypothetical protein